MDFSSIESWQITLLTTIVGGIMGVIGSLVVKWYDKKKSPRDEDREAAIQLISAAKDNVTTTQQLIDILEDRLKKERSYYDGLIDRSKQECDFKITEMKKLQDNMIEDLQAQIIRGNIEKDILSKQIDKLTEEKIALQREVKELNERIKKYYTHTSEQVETPKNE